MHLDIHNNRRLYATVAAACWLLAGAAIASAEGRGEALLRGALTRLHDANTYYCEIAVTVRDGAKPPRNAKGWVSAMKPNYLRVELPSWVTTVSDGAFLYTHVSGDRNYFRVPSPPSPLTVPGRWEAEIDGFFGGPDLVSQPDFADAVAEGSGEVAGFQCHVVRVRMTEPERTVTYAIGIADSLIHRSVIATPGPSGTVYIANTLTAVRLNAPMQPDRFAYAAPQGVESTETSTPVV